MKTNFKPNDVIRFRDTLYQVLENHGEFGVARQIPDGVPQGFPWEWEGDKAVKVGSVLVWDPKCGKDVTDAMWAEYMASPVPDGWEATGEVRCSKMDEVYLNPVNVWNNLPPEAIAEECDWSQITHFCVGDGPVKSVNEPPVARRILRRV